MIWKSRKNIVHHARRLEQLHLSYPAAELESKRAKCCAEQCHMKVGEESPCRFRKSQWSKTGNILLEIWVFQCEPSSFNPCIARNTWLNEFRWGKESVNSLILLRGPRSPTRAICTAACWHWCDIWVTLIPVQNCTTLCGFFRISYVTYEIRKKLRFYGNLELKAVYIR